MIYLLIVMLASSWGYWTHALLFAVLGSPPEWMRDRILIKHMREIAVQERKTQFS
jgi:hypothetical protein